MCFWRKDKCCKFLIVTIKFKWEMVNIFESCRNASANLRNLPISLVQKTQSFRSITYENRYYMEQRTTLSFPIKHTYYIYADFLYVVFSGLRFRTSITIYICCKKRKVLRKWRNGRMGKFTSVCTAGIWNSILRTIPMHNIQKT